MTLWGSREGAVWTWRDDIVGQQGGGYGHGEMKIVEQQGTVWTRIAKDTERWRSLAEGYFRKWKDTA